MKLDIGMGIDLSIGKCSNFIGIRKNSTLVKMHLNRDFLSYYIYMWD